MVSSFRRLLLCATAATCVATLSVACSAASDSSNELPVVTHGSATTASGDSNSPRFAVYGRLDSMVILERLMASRAGEVAPGEVELYTLAGIPNAEALHLATYNAAEFLDCSIFTI